MIEGQRVLAVCPARGGSKGIPRKNLALFLGRPLVAHVGDVVAKIPAIDRAVVSTDDVEIARVAREAGLDAPFLRPESLSGDRISDLQVLTHALEETEKLDGVRYDVVLMLQPTSPLRRVEHVERTLAMLVKEGWDAVWTVSETDSKAHPLKQLRVDAESGALDLHDPAGHRIIARQQLAPVYHRNGVAYAITRRCLLEERSIMGRRTGALVLNGHLVSIDTPFDLALCEFVARQREEA
ncbi:MAG: acylneuraminate cytidylyltransferase family protein [Myxococcota bacterium]|nr:acylneuraminate cytidylyltransferase family protein [Myxococcota bacterium]